MRRNITTYMAALLLAIAPVSCSKQDSGSGSRDIRIAPAMSEKGTKALLETEDLGTAGTAIKVFGIADGGYIRGHKPNGTEGDSYLDGSTMLVHDGTGWAFDSGEAYQWVPEASHRFFGWLDTDAKPATPVTASGFFGAGFAFDGSSLTIPAKNMGIREDNLDFAYSDIVTRSATGADYSTVELSLNHLFASFSLSARNYTKKKLDIKKVTIHGIHDGKSASLDYSSSSVAVSYAGGSTMAPTDLFNNTSSPTITLSKAGDAGDAKANIVGGASDAVRYFLVWPQTEAEMTAAGTETEGVWTPSDSSQPYIEIVYRIEGDSNDLIVDVPIPHDSDDNPDNDTAYGLGWAAGIRHKMELSFHDKEIALSFTAANWKEQSPIIDYDGTPSVTTPLAIAPEFIGNCTTATVDGEKVAYFKAGYPIVMQFAINQPENATWIVGKDGDWDVFDVYNYPDGARKTPEETVTAEGVIDGHMVKIAIDPPTGNLQKNEYSIRLSFSIRKNSGEMVNIDEIIFDSNSPREFVFIK